MNIDEIKSIIHSYGDFIWFGQRGTDCIGLHEVVNFKEIICCDYGVDLENICAKNGYEIFSQEKEGQNRKNWSNLSLDTLLKGELSNRINQLFRQNNRNIVAYTSTAQLERITSNYQNINILSCSASLKKKLDDKFYLRNNLRDLDIRAIPGKIDGFSNVINQKRNLKYPLVIQLPFGSSGNNSYYVENSEQLKNINIDPEKMVIVSPYIQGLSPNVNLLIVEDKVIVSYPSIQIIGYQGATLNKLGYCGNDFSSSKHLPASAITSIQQQALKIGKWISQQGYRGMLGIDFFWDGQYIYPVEINPRFQNSTQLLTQLQLLKHQIPLASLQILDYLRLSRKKTEIKLPISSYYMDPLDGAQLILHSLEKVQTTVLNSITPGVYSIKNGRVEFSRAGESLKDCQSDNEFLIFGSVPTSGTTVYPFAPLLKIQTKLNFLGIDGNVSDFTKNICKQIYSLLNLRSM